MKVALSLNSAETEVKVLLNNWVCSNYLPKETVLSQKESCLQWGGTSQFFDLWEANPAPLGKVQGRSGVYVQVLALFWDLDQCREKPPSSLLKTRQRNRDMHGSWSLSTTMMAEFCSARWKFPTLTSKPFICQCRRLCQKCFCTFWWQALEKRSMAWNSVTANCGFH